MITLDHYDQMKDGTLPKRSGWRESFRSRVLEGQAGDWKVEQFEIELGIANLRMMRDGRGCRPGTYTRLIHARRGVVMSDTDAEASDHSAAYFAARGRLLIHGLGLGCYLGACLSKPSVEHIDVVELDADVLALVAPHFKGERVTFHHGDCMTKKWPAGTAWNVVWHDIWDALCEDNLPAMHKLHRKFGRRCDWQGSWGRDFIESRR